MAAVSVLSIALSACGSDGAGSASAGAGAPEPSATTSPSAESNGIAELSAEEILRRTDALLGEASWYRQVVSFTEDFDSTGSTDLTFGSGGRCFGEVYDPSIGTLEMTRQGDDFWLKLDEESYVHAPADHDAIAAHAELCASPGLPESVLAGQPADSGLETTSLVVEEAEDQGRVPVVAVRREESGEGPDADTVTSELLIAAQGEPYPVQLRVVTDSPAQGTTTVEKFQYTQFGVDPGFETPAVEQTVEIDDLDFTLDLPAP
ncbi:hypothetical protein [Streptomyces millisiae]|uniref:Lipoprotein n=1 Tax=Streptomyces millisiae TaxID=3075542 RepID=A0ABU2LR26_9ACTN|nr:hypothetical protein [Streptomyces sp. DSM 44918]MDT0320042.1 hypothetical protein [Streptomyces sp. DSM 44918]